MLAASVDSRQRLGSDGPDPNRRSQGNIEIFGLLFGSVVAQVQQLLEDWRRGDTDPKLEVLLEGKILDELTQGGEGLKTPIRIIRDIQDRAVNKEPGRPQQTGSVPVTSPEDSRFAADLAGRIARETVATYARQPLLGDDFVRHAVVNRRDEFGNTMLHLAAWNSKPEMFDHLIALGADPTAENRYIIHDYRL